MVGTHALYAYETAAGVRIVPAALATQDVDLLWDARRRVQFVTDLGRTQTSVLGVLRRADATFERKPGHPETAINAKGFEVDFLRRQPEHEDPHPFRFSDDEADLWPIQAVRAAVLTSAALRSAGDRGDRSQGADPNHRAGRIRRIQALDGKGGASA